MYGLSGRLPYHTLSSPSPLCVDTDHCGKLVPVHSFGRRRTGTNCLKTVELSSEGPDKELPNIRENRGETTYCLGYN
jgi:hypothetical protein